MHARASIARQAALCFLLLNFSVPVARAQISPGELSRYHAQLEGLANCTACHELRKEVSNKNCLVCHHALRARMDAKLGYHASLEVNDRNCRECHSEHNGRDYELIYWQGGRDQFAHQQTGFELRGAHARQDCRACHKATFIKGPVAADANINRDRTFLGLETTCTSCHVDEHRDQLTDDCMRCHDVDAWTPAPKFWHTNTRYPLTGKHTAVNCTKCHPLQPAALDAGASLLDKRTNRGTSARYSGLSFGSCADCHDDAHRGKFGLHCAECHTTEGFNARRGAPFDHSRTAFSLQGKHAAVACVQCHPSGRKTEPLSHARCADCHRDRHRGQFTHRARRGACEECHTVDGFVPSTFDLALHDSTRYPLTGSHLAVSCRTCHTEIQAANESYARYRFSDLSCQGCHADAHRGQLKHWIEKNGCEFCHTTETWHRTSFDHQRARFALEGKHREILCLKCHTVVNDSTGESTLWMKPLVMECSGCHRDIHHGQFVRESLGENVTRCERCHSPAGWKQLRFIHNRDAAFVLDGAHEKLACAGCHKPAKPETGPDYLVYRPLGTACADCHAANERPRSSHE